MDFGFTLKPEHSIERTIALTRQAEAAGFSYGWLFDSHILWKDVYPLLTLMAVNTDKMRLGTCVTNPATRDITVTASVLATLDEISGGRMDLGIGRGDSAQRVLGKGPVKTRVLDNAVRIIKDLVEGRTATYMDTQLDLTWTPGYELPVWIAGYGPMVLGMAGRTADGIILQLADPALIEWLIGIMRQAATEAGRDPAEDQGAGGGTCPRRPHRRMPRARALVPGPGQQPRRGPGEHVPPRAIARFAHRLHPRPRGLRLPPPCRGRLGQRAVRQ